MSSPTLRMLKENWLSIAAAESASFIVAQNYDLGSAVAANAVGLSIPVLKRAIMRSHEMPPRFGAGRSRSRYLSEDPQEVIATYPAETPIAPSLPYSELANFCDLLAASRKPRITLEVEPQEFELQKWDDPHLDALVARAEASLRDEGRVTRDSNVVRASAIHPLPDGAVLRIQKARYSAQARSNLIVDYRMGRDPTLRSRLRSEYGPVLPFLHDRRLVNSIGCAALILAYSGDVIQPFFQLRSKGVAVFNRGGWHCTASGAAEWPDNPATTPRTFAAYIEDDIRNELLQEAGLNPDEVHLELVAICREFMRAGKPQLFFLGFTELPPHAIARRAEAARRRQELAQKQSIEAEPVETLKRPYLHEARSFTDASEVDMHAVRAGFTSEAAACLYYFFRLMDATG